jgi:hypothetical protein
VFVSTEQCVKSRAFRPGGQLVACVAKRQTPLQGSDTPAPYVIGHRRPPESRDGVT